MHWVLGQLSSLLFSHILGNTKLIVFLLSFSLVVECSSSRCSYGCSYSWINGYIFFFSRLSEFLSFFPLLWIVHSRKPKWILMRWVFEGPTGFPLLFKFMLVNFCIHFTLYTKGFLFWIRLFCCRLFILFTQSPLIFIWCLSFKIIRNYVQEVKFSRFWANRFFFILNLLIFTQNFNDKVSILLQNCFFAYLFRFSFIMKLR